MPETAHEVLAVGGPGGLDAEFVPALGMLGCSLRHRGRELLDRRDGIRAYASRGATMGIPLLHPWANRLDRPLDSPLVRTDEHGTPIHGVLPSALPFEVGFHEQGALYASFDTDAQPQVLQVFPHPHRLEVQALLSESALRLRATLTAASNEAVPVAFGYHPYLCLPDLPRPEWQVRLPVRRRLVLDERLLPTGAVEEVEPYEGPLGERTFDDGFCDLEEPAEFALFGAGLRVSVVFEQGYRFAQVYAPPGQDLVCFEPMTAPANALASGEGLSHARPGEPYVAAFSIRVEEGSS
jgi:aldose 1-epimerase